MKKTLYVSDLDGTLLGSDSRVSERSAQIISELSQAGAEITVATARTPATVVPLLADTFTRPDAIVMTGAATWSRTKNAFGTIHYMPEADVTAGLDLCRRMGVHPFVYTMRADGSMLDVYHGASAMNKAEESFYLERLHLKLKRFHTGTPLPPSSLPRTMLFFAMGERAKVEEAAAALREQTDCAVCCYPDIFNHSVANLEVFAPGVSKAAAVLELKKQIGADRLVVFGDNLNDLPMLAVADVAVAVDNAFPEVKERADVVIGPNFTDSVAKYILQDYTRQ